MALRILPFRQYDENDVINLYSLDETIPADPSADGVNAAGVVVKITAGVMGDEVISLDDNAYLGKKYAAPVGQNKYPSNPLKVKSAGNDAKDALGITLRQTLSHDENGEKLLYYRLKADELQAVLPGETVPVLTKGVVTLSADAVTGALVAGNRLQVAAAGKLKLLVPDASAITQMPCVGKVLAVGERKAGTYPDQFAGASGASEKYYVVQINF
tara:strand:- start:372 stop:1013 length:642 start_codon:yes stop_codon:yes gene_type:complete